MPTTTDNHFAEKAIELANTSARYLEEARSYAHDIEDKHLREETEKKIDRIIEEL